MNMNYNAKVSGGGNQSYGECGNNGNLSIGAILVLFILLVILTRIIC